MFASRASADDGPTDVEGSKDHPAVKRYPGSVITEFSQKEFESFAFPVADTAEGVKTKPAEGKFYFATLQYPAKTGCTQVRRNYENAFKAAGMTMHQGVNSPWDRGWFGEHLGWTSAEGKASGKGGQLYIVVSCGEQDGTSGNIWVIEEKAMEQKVEIDAGAMADELDKTGHIALYGINFATGKADITPDSAKTLGEVAKVLTLKKTWKLKIVGHTDNVGRAAANLELSKKRAAAVKDYLVTTSKIAADRLTTDGLGDTQPLAPNKTDEARAKNRRVELVKL